MNLTEAEAKTLACCGPLQTDPNAIVIKCLGSGCMAWRWEHGGPQYYAVPHYDAHPPERKFGYIGPDTRGGHAMEVWRRGEGPERGHCGLAGKPA